MLTAVNNGELGVNTLKRVVGEAICRGTGQSSGLYQKMFRVPTVDPGLCVCVWRGGGITLSRIERKTTLAPKAYLGECQ